MVRVDMKMPKYCANCPFLVVHKGTDFLPTFLCKAKWRKLEHEYICKERAKFCPITEEGVNEPIAES